MGRAGEYWQYSTASPHQSSEIWDLYRTGGPPFDAQYWTGKASPTKEQKVQSWLIQKATTFCLPFWGYFHKFFGYSRIFNIIFHSNWLFAILDLFCTSNLAVSFVNLDKFLITFLQRGTVTRTCTGNFLYVEFWDWTGPAGPLGTRTGGLVDWLVFEELPHPWQYATVIFTKFPDLHFETSNHLW